MSKFITFFILSLLFISCGKKAGTTQTKLSFFGGNSSMLNSGVQMNGGIIVSGYKKDGTDKFSIALANANDEKVLELSKGDWEFVAIGWTGSAAGNFTGANRCAYTGVVNLFFNDTAITFNLDFASCASVPNHGEVFSPASYMSSVVAPNQFLTLDLKSCDALILGTSPVCSATPGLMKSFQVIAHSSFGFADLSSNCQAPLDANSYLKTSLAVPVGNFINNNNESIMKLSVKTYTSTDCTGKGIVYDFKDSMLSGIRQATLKAGTAVANGATTLWIESNAMTGTGLGALAGDGHDGVLTLTAAPFYQETNSTTAPGTIPVVPPDYGWVTNIDVVAGTPSVSVAPAEAASIATGDEIMWYVNFEASIGCGGGLKPSMYGFAKVIGTPTLSVQKVIPLDHSILDYVPNGAPPLKLAKPTNFATICSIQIVKVKNFYDINVPGVAGTINVANFDANLSVGGLFPFRVKNQILISDVSGSFGSLTINASGRGQYMPTVLGCVNGVLTGSGGKRCMPMGGNQTGSMSYMGPINGGTYKNGGGTIYAKINKLNIISSAAIPVSFQSSGTTPSTDGGYNSTEVQDISYTGGYVPGPYPTPIISYGINWQAGTIGQKNGVPGVLLLHWCTLNGVPSYVNYPIQLATGHTQGCIF